jgi:tRNA A58 N-methylase Trm61
MRLALLLACAAFGCRGPLDSRSASVAQDSQAQFDAERPVEQVLDALSIRSGSKVADIAAGNGHWTLHLAETIAPRGHVVATELDRDLMIALDRRLESRAVEDLVEVRIVDPAQPGFEPGTFQSFVYDDHDALADETGTYDAILLAEVDQMLPDEPAWLAHAAPALKHDGRLVIVNTLAHRDHAIASAQNAGLRPVTSAEYGPFYVAAFTPR